MTKKTRIFSDSYYFFSLYFYFFTQSQIFFLDNFIFLYLFWRLGIRLDILFEFIILVVLNVSRQHITIIVLLVTQAYGCLRSLIFFIFLQFLQCLIPHPFFSPIWGAGAISVLVGQLDKRFRLTKGLQHVGISNPFQILHFTLAERVLGHLRLSFFGFNNDIFSCIINLLIYSLSLKEKLRSSTRQCSCV